MSTIIQRKYSSSSLDRVAPQVEAEMQRREAPQATLKRKSVVFVFATILFQVIILSAALFFRYNNQSAPKTLDHLAQNEAVSSMQSSDPLNSAVESNAEVDPFENQNQLETQIQNSNNDEQLLAQPKLQAPLLVEALVDSKSDSKNESALEKSKQAPMMVAEQSDSKLPSVLKNANKVISYKVERGDNLSTIWRKNGATLKSALLAGKAFEKSGISLSSIKFGDKLDLYFNQSGEIVGLTKKLAQGKLLVLSAGSENAYVSEIVVSQLIENDRVVVGTIKSSFANAIAENNVPYVVIDELVDLFGNRVEFRKDFQPGDQFTLIYTERRLASGEIVEPGAISAASISLSGKMLAVVRKSTKEDKSIYFDESGQHVGNYFLRYPVKFSRISSVFSDSRLHPVLGIRRPHNGVDFAAPVGTPVRAVADGVINYAGYKSASGNMIKIAHGPRYATAYLHLSKIYVKNGSKVKRGDLIGAVGMTGLASGPHLHFSFYDRGKYMDPLKMALPALQMPSDQAIPANYLQAVLKTLKHYHEVQTYASNQASGISPKV